MSLPKEILQTLLLFPKAVIGGVVATTFVWVLIVFYNYWQITRIWKQKGFTGPVAVAGGVTYLLNSTWVVMLLTVAFGVGFYLVTLTSRR